MILTIHQPGRNEKIENFRDRWIIFRCQELLLDRLSSPVYNLFCMLKRDRTTRGGQRFPQSTGERKRGMDVEKRVALNWLMDFYGPLLTENRARLLRLY